MSTIRDPAVITTAGRQMMTAGGDISYTKAVLYGQDISHLTKEQLAGLTSIGNPLLTVPVGISDKNDVGASTTVVLEATFQNANLKADLTYTAVGFFAKRSDDAEKLVIVGVANSGACLVAASPDGVATDALDIKVAIAIGDATSVTAVIDPAGSVTPATLSSAISKATHELTDQINLLSDTKNEVAKKADSDDVEKELAKKANSFDVTNSIKQLTDMVNTKVDQSAVDSAVKPISDALNAKANTADVYLKTDIDNTVNNLKDLIANAGKLKTISIDGGTPASPDTSGNVNIDLSKKADASSLQALDSRVTALENKPGDIVTVTQAQYDQLVKDGKVQQNVIYAVSNS